MGLDISYYGDIQEIPNVIFNEDGEAVRVGETEPIDYESYFRAHVNSDFPERADNLKDGAAYSFKDSDGFRAGSYGGYNVWRERLAELADYPATECDESDYRRGKRHDAGAFVAGKGPFYELIWFSDCEGVIGSVTSAKLAKDFQTFQPKADAVDEEWWRLKYAEWRKAFEVAANNGAVDFH